MQRMIENPTYVSLFVNIAFLLSLALIFDLLNLKVRRQNILTKQILIGILIGGIGVLVMLTPWVLMPGIVFDTRSVLLSTSGLFFGTIPTLVAMAITIALRIYQGGGGALTGVLVILATGCLGIAWHYYRKGSLNKAKWWEFYLFGILTHLVMLALMFTLPKESIFPTLRSITLPVLLIYPAGNLLLGLLLRNRLNREINQEKLIDLTDRLKRTQEISRVGGWEFDVVTQKINWTQEVYRIHGYDPEDFEPGSSEHIDKSIMCYHPDDRPVIFDAFNKCVQFGISYDMEFPLTTVKGEEKWIRTKAEPVFENGKVVRVVGNFIDITDKKIAENELQESETRYRALLESAPVGIVVILDNKIEYINPAALALAGATDRQQMLGKPINEFIHPTMLNVSRNNIESLTAHGQSVVKSENIFLKLDRSPIYVETTATKIVYQGKTAVQVIFTDISERKAAEEKKQKDQEILQELLSEADRSRRSLLSLIEDQRQAEESIRKLNEELELRVQERTAQLESSNKELEAFAYSVSHDLRAPLRGIDGFSRILEQEYATSLDEEGKRIVNIIRKSTSKMDQLIVDILALSRVSRQNLQFSWVDMQTMANSIFHEIASPDVIEKFAVDISELPAVEADPTLMRLVWANLLSNAVKYTKTKTNCKIWIKGQEEDGFCVYSIQDNGVGYDSRYENKLFGLFQRLHSEREFEGTGVGLAIVQRIIHRHKGSVWSESTLGEGATFYFSIPKRQINNE